MSHITTKNQPIIIYNESDFLVEIVFLVMKSRFKSLFESKNITFAPSVFVTLRRDSSSRMEIILRLSTSLYLGFPCASYPSGIGHPAFAPRPTNVMREVSSFHEYVDPESENSPSVNQKICKFGRSQ